MALCLFLFDDAQLGARLPRPRAVVRAWRRAPALALAALILAGNAYYLARPFVAVPRALTRVLVPLEPLRLVNGYGLFAVMTTTRPEIDIQGSADGRHWESYGFRYKPGDPRRGLRWNVPHQPRLDWQMWFAALARAGETPWFGRFLERLLLNAEPVTGLLAHNPFPATPPRRVRAVLYDYRFSTAAERRASGAIWTRRALGLYYPPVRLR
jgi:hypothetical protein